MRHHAVPDSILRLAVKALRFQARETHRVGAIHSSEEWKAADELERTMKYPAAKPHVTGKHAPAHNI